MVRGVNHVQVNIPSYGMAAAREFYVKFMGFREIGRPASFKTEGLWLLAGNFEIHLGVEDGVERSKTRAHVAYEVEDLTAWRKKIAAKGWAIQEQPLIPGYARFQFRDPFGNNIELIRRITTDKHR